MTLKDILGNLKYDVVSDQENEVVLTESSFLLDLMDVDGQSDDKKNKGKDKDQNPDQDKEKESFSLIDLSLKKLGRFPVTELFLKIVLWLLAAMIKLLYGIANLIRWMVTGKKKDLSTSPRFNFVLFIFLIIGYIVALAAIFIFFLKSVLLFKPSVGMNEQGAITISQSCGREHYMYLFNTADCWANTGIKVLEGDQVVVTASGSFYSDIDSMCYHATNNSKPDYSRSLIYINQLRNKPRTICDMLTNKTEPKATTQKVWMYHADDARFGSLLMQIEEEGVKRSYSSDDNTSKEKKIQQLLFKENSPKSIQVKKSGYLFFAVNDIFLTPAVKDTILNDTILRNTLGLRTDSVFAKYGNRLDSIERIWYYDNVGEVFLSITVIRDKKPQEIPMCSGIVKLYRSCEAAILAHSCEDCLLMIVLIIVIVAFVLLLDHTLGRRLINYFMLRKKTNTSQNKQTETAV